MRNGIRLSALILLLILSALAFAQKEVIHWKATVDKSSVAPNGWLIVRFDATIDKGWHLYSQKPIVDGPQPTTFSLPEGSALQEIGKASQTPPLKRIDPNFGKEVEYYSDSATFQAPVKVSKTATGPQQAKVSVRFMSCDDRQCMPPRTVEVPFTFTVSGAPIAEAPPPTLASTTSDTPAPQGGVNDRVDAAKKQGLLAFLLLSVSFGFLALLTPCVFPMIPITVSFFAKQRDTAGTRSVLGQALAYCFGIMLTFTALGLIVARIYKAAGVNALAANPWLNLALAILFIALALNLFGVFEVRLPYGLANRLSPQGKGRYAAPLMMAFAFTITSFTCTMPLVGTLLVGASQGEYIYPILGMLAFSAAFSLPFFLLAMFPQAIRQLPRSGAWMVVIKAFMGFLEIAAAVKFISNADLVWQLGWLTRPVFLAVWAAILAVAGLYMLGWLRIPTVDDGKIGIPRRLVGLACVVSALTMLAAINGRNLGELDAFLPPSEYGMAKADKGNWIEDYEKGLALARSQGKPVFIDFTGVTCTNCRQMEKNVFPKPEVADRFNRFVLVRLYTDRDQDSDRANQKLQQKLTGSVTLPIYVTLTPDGKPLRIFEGSTRDVDSFVRFLDEGLQKVAQL